MYLTFKRIFDIILSSIAIILLSPILILIIVTLKLTGEGEIFYLQERVFECALGLGPEARDVSLQRSPEKACRSKGRPVPLPWEVHRRAQP